MKTHSLSMAAAVLASFATLPAQDPPHRGQPERAAPVQGRGTQERSGSTTEADRFLATWLLVGNHSEIELAQLAQQRAQDPQVKEFARTLLQDHREFGQKLQQFGDLGAMAGGRTDPGGRTGLPGRDDPTRGDPTRGDPTRDDPGRDDPGRDQPGRDQPGRPVDATSGRTGMGGGFQPITVITELGQECLASAKQELQSKTGAEFDRAYVNMQIVGHMKTLDAIKVFQRHASERLRPVLQQGQQTVQTHLQRAKQVCMQLEKGADSGTGR